jgi:subtilase family serine protease
MQHKQLRINRRRRSLCQAVEILEPRVLLSASPHKAKAVKIKPIQSHSTISYKLEPRRSPGSGSSGSTITTSNTGTSTPLYGLTPAQIRGAYLGSSGINFDGIVGDGSGQTIAIIDPYDDPDFVNSTASNYTSSDLYLFDQYFGLPNPPSFTKYGIARSHGGNYTVSTTLPPTDPNGPYDSTGNYGDELETSLDVEWAHVMAPMAKIVLIESNGFTYIYDAVQAADNLSGVNVVSMSFGGDENQPGIGSASEESQLNTTYFNKGTITYVASAGDSGAYGNSANSEQNSIEPQFPASSSNVLTAGGTTLSVTSSNAWSSEITWGDGTGSGSYGGGGGGTSMYESKPSYQTALLGSGGNREYPDIALNANTSTGVPVLDSWDDGTGTGWVAGVVGGTSLAAPLMAGLVSIADQGRALDGLPTLNSNGNGNVDIHSLLYSLAGSSTSYNADFHDIVSGLAIGPSPTYSPATGYDLASGLGSPNADDLVFDLSGISSTLAVNQPAITNLYYKQDTSSSYTDIWVNSATPGSGTPTYTFADADITSVLYNAVSGNDVFTLNFSAGNTFATGLSSITYTGSSTGSNALNIIGSATSNDTFVATSSNISVGSVTVAFSNAQTLTINPGTGTDSLTVNSGTWNIANQTAGGGILTRNFSSISIASAAKLFFNTASAHTDRMLVETSSLSDTGRLDLGGNDMIIHNGSLGSITGLLTAGYAGGNWNGSGISSTAAAGDTTHLTALGVIQNTIYNAGNKFDNASPVSSDIIIKYTYYGDTNLDGKVDGSDYTNIDNGYMNNLTGWANGDLNYDNKVNGSDYTLMDNTFNQQGSQM